MAGSVQFTPCPECGNPFAYAERNSRTGGGFTECPACGYYAALQLGGVNEEEVELSGSILERRGDRRGR